MKRILYITCFILIHSESFALNIRQIVVSRLSDSAINISLDTEAKELYYFSSWDYEILENTIVLDAYFIEGFGSTIAFLNNNFEIPLDTLVAQTFYLIVNVYYVYSQEDDLADSQSGFFTTPLENSLFLPENLSEEANQNELKFVNPSNGKLVTNVAVKDIYIVDEASKKSALQINDANVIDISNLSDGHYLLCYSINGRYKTTRIILRKN
jgi:hypothetical protein